MYLEVVTDAFHSVFELVFDGSKEVLSINCGRSRNSKILFSLPGISVSLIEIRGFPDMAAINAKSHRQKKE